MLLGKRDVNSVLLNTSCRLKKFKPQRGKMNKKKLIIVKFSLLMFILSSHQISCNQLSRQCNFQHQFWCDSLENSKCLKLTQKCFSGSALWKDYTSPNLFVNVDKNKSENVLFESLNVLENMSRLRFELRKFENSTFFKRIFDIGLFNPASEMMNGIVGNCRDW
jgi:hypothetical protein